MSLRRRTDIVPGMQQQSLHYFFVGIGGSGMSALADIMRLHGHRVSGSDRGRDMGQGMDKFKVLSDAGMTLHPQDGSGIGPGVDFVVVSSAVEETIPDIQAARRHNISVLRRAELLAQNFNGVRGIGIAGTSGKTTTTGMTGWMLHALGLDPTIINGGIMPNFVGHPGSLIGNALAGGSDLCVAEMDESDGTIALYTPAIAVLNNITLDHKPFDVLEPLFSDFLCRARERAIVNLDDPRAAAMRGLHPHTLTYGVACDDADIVARDIRHLPGGTALSINGHRGTLIVPGMHNVSNALAAVAVAVSLGVDIADALDALSRFRGIRRRLETIGVTGGITVIDDFAHNPDKIAASLATLTAHPGRLLVMFQPHGFAPMRMMRGEITDAFSQGLRAQDVLWMPEIFYAGGNVTRDISAADLIGDISGRGIDARFMPTRNDCATQIMAEAKPGDRVVIMGARDETLGAFAADILNGIVSGAAVAAPRYAAPGRAIGSGSNQPE